VSRKMISLEEYSSCCTLFIARQHTDARYWYSNSVCLSVHPWHAGIVSKRLNISSCFLYHTIAHSF